jgi:hypothetical protein
MHYMAQPLSFRWRPEFIAEIDDARGDIPRSAFVRRAVEDSLPTSGTLDVVQRLNAWEVDVLSALREALEERERLQGDSARIDQRIDSLVAAAREIRVSWQSIGKVLGMSKQAAWERYGKTDPHPLRGRPPEEDER